jgi:hypothetical protein
MAYLHTNSFDFFSPEKWPASCFETEFQGNITKLALERIIIPNEI